MQGLIYDENFPHLGGNEPNGESKTFSPKSWNYIIERFKIKSVLDLGSGLGHNAKWFYDKGIKTIAIEGLEQNVKNSLVDTIHHDLTKGKIEIESVDLVICTEVVEHIQELYLDNLLSSLSNGKYILMTHATHTDGGHHHVNNQKSDYWIEHLNKKDFILLEQETKIIREMSGKEGAFFLNETGMLFKRKSKLKETANMFWHGELSEFEKMSIKSFVNNGFNVKLWSYTNLKVEGVESCDARLVLSEEHLTKYRQGHYDNNLSDETYTSIAIFSDVFRYNVIAKFGGWWFDCDCFCLKHTEYFSELRKGKLLVAGLQDASQISVASGVFYAEQDTAKMMVKDLNGLLNQYNNTFPKWGIVGPEFITDFVQRHKLYHGVTSIEKFYSINGSETHFFINSDLKSVAKSLIKNSYITHIWDSIIKYMIDKNNFPEGSLLEEFYNDSYNNNEDVNINTINQYNHILSRYLRISEIYDKLNKKISIDDMKNYIRNNTSDVEIVKTLKGRN